MKSGRWLLFCRPWRARLRQCREWNYPKPETPSPETVGDLPLGQVQSRLGGCDPTRGGASEEGRNSGEAEVCLEFSQSSRYPWRAAMSQCRRHSPRCNPELRSPRSLGRTTSSSRASLADSKRPGVDGRRWASFTDSPPRAIRPTQPGRRGGTGAWRPVWPSGRNPSAIGAPESPRPVLVHPQL